MNGIAQRVALAVLAVAIIVVLVSQRLEHTALQAELAQANEARRERDRLRDENHRLVAAQPADEELARLRADHAAIERLRQEIERVDADAARKLGELAASPVPASQSVAARFQLSVGETGELAVRGRPVSLAELRAQLSPYAVRGERVEIRMQRPAALSEPALAGLKKAVEGVAALGRELKLPYELKLEAPPPTP